jgi:hypothetical protein
MGQPELSDSNNSRAWQLVIPQSLWSTLNSHLFRNDNDEHGAVILAGVTSTSTGQKLLARELLIAEDGIDYVPGERGYRALTPEFIAKAARRAQRGKWSYIAVHCHGGRNSVAFSSVDLASHERGYPALTQLIGRPVAGLVLAENAAAGDLWLLDGGRLPLSVLSVVGENLRLIRSDDDQSHPVFEAFERQARLLGETGQQHLQRLRVGVVGLGGAGSMAAEMLVRIGVGELVYIDPDTIELSNISRVLGSEPKDGMDRGRPKLPLFRRRSRSGPKLKVEIALTNARRAGLTPRIEVHATDVSDPIAARSLTTCDWIVLAADSQTARHVVNTICHAFLIPVIQVGVKIPVDQKTGEVGSIFCVSRHITPDSGCMWCNGLIDATELQLEATGDEGERARQYVGPDAPAPSVITLNGVAVSVGLTELLLSTAGLLEAAVSGTAHSGYLRYSPRSHRMAYDEPRKDSDCLYCGRNAASLFARGDDALLPVRPSSSI